jgi:hypothetical protein
MTVTFPEISETVMRYQVSVLRWTPFTSSEVDVIGWVFRFNPRRANRHKYNTMEGTVCIQSLRNTGAGRHREYFSFSL